MKTVKACESHMADAEREHAMFMQRADVKRVIVTRDECGSCRVVSA